MSTWDQLVKEADREATSPQPTSESPAATTWDQLVTASNAENDQVPWYQEAPGRIMAFREDIVRGGAGIAGDAFQGVGDFIRIATAGDPNSYLTQLGGGAASVFEDIGDFVSNLPMATPDNQLMRYFRESTGVTDEMLAKDQGFTKFLQTDLPTAIGQTGGFAIMGATSPWRVALMGGLVGADETYDEAIANGMNPGEAFSNYAIGFGFGTLEALPIMGLYRRANKATGGMLDTVFSNPKYGKALLTGRDAALQALEEGLQEAAQAWGSNLAAQRTFDPERELTQGMLPAAAAGGGAGAIISTLLSTITRTRMRPAPTQSDRITSHNEAIALALEKQEERNKIEAPAGYEGPEYYEGEFASIDDTYYEYKREEQQLLSKLVLSGMPEQEAIPFLDQLIRASQWELELAYPLPGKDPLGSGGPNEYSKISPTVTYSTAIKMLEDGNYAPEVISTLHEQMWSYISKATEIVEGAGWADENARTMLLGVPRITHDRAAGFFPPARFFEDTAGWAAGTAMPNTPAAFNATDRFVANKKKLADWQTKIESQPVMNLAGDLGFVAGEAAGQSYWRFDWGDGVLSRNFRNEVLSSLKRQYVEQSTRSKEELANPTQEVLDERNAWTGKRAVTEAKVLQKWYKEQAQDMERVATNVLKKLGITDSGLIITDRFGNERPNALGEHWSTEQDGRSISGIHVSMKELLMAKVKLRGVELNPTATDAQKADARKRLKQAEASTWSTFSHEVGHAIVANIFGKNSKATIQEQRALLHGYLRWLEARMNDKEQAGFMASISSYDSLINILKEGEGRIVRRAIEKGLLAAGTKTLPVNMATGGLTKEGVLAVEDVLSEVLAQDMTPAVVNQSIRNQVYHLSFDEYMAEMVARDMGRMKSPISDAIYEGLGENGRKAFKETRMELRRVYDIFKSKLDSETFENWTELMSLRGKLNNHIKKLKAQSTWKGIGGGLAGKVPGLDADEFKGWREDQDKFNKFFDIALGVLHLAEANPHIVPLQEYKNNAEAMEILRNRWLERGHLTLRQWRNTFKSRGRRKVMRNFERALFEETLREKAWTADEKKEKWFEGITFNQELFDTMLGLETSIKKDFADILTEMETMLVEQVRDQMEPGQELEEELAEIKKDFAKMKATPFFPLFRFGKYTVEVTAKQDGLQLPDTYDFKEFGKKTFKSGDRVIFETYDNKAEQSKQYDQLKRTLGTKGFSVGRGLLTDSQASWQAMPVSLLRHIKRSMPNLTEAQKRDLDDLIKRALPAQGFRKRFLRRKKTFGWNNDGVRSYAAYMRQAAGHLAKVKYSGLLQDNISSIRQTSKDIRKGNGDSEKRDKIGNWMQEHYDYLMSPETDLAWLRSLGFTYYIGYNLKSAVINLTQLPLTTYPYLGNEYGDAKAIRELTRLVKDIPKMFTMKNPPFNAEEMQMVEKGMEEGWLNQSLATELAIANNSGRFQNSWAYTGTNLQRMLFNIQEWGAVPFAKAEKINRVTTGMAAYRLERQRGGSHEKAMQAAKDAVQRTQYEYTRWNRPWLMRGKKSVLFLFMQYVTNTLYFATGRNGASVRFMLMMLLMAGWQGLPFAEDLTDIVEWLVNKEDVKKIIGAKPNNYIDLRTDAREFIRGLNMEPDLLLNGISSNTFGMANMAEYFGWSFPKLDLSASISMGRIIPGIEALNRMDGGVDSFVASAAERGTGALGAGVMSTLKAFMSNDPDTWRRFEKALPTALKNFSRAARLADRGIEKTKAGEKIAEFDVHDPVDAVELAFASIGFTPRDLGLGWQGYIRGTQAARYYANRRSNLMLRFNWALEHRDNEELSDARAAIREYNRTVPWKELSISGDEMRQSARTYMTRRARGELGLPPTNREIRLRRDVAAAYAEEYRGEQ